MDNFLLIFKAFPVSIFVCREYFTIAGLLIFWENCLMMNNGRYWHIEFIRYGQLFPAGDCCMLNMTIVSTEDVHRIQKCKTLVMLLAKKEYYY